LELPNGPEIPREFQLTSPEKQKTFEQREKTLKMGKSQFSTLQKVGWKMTMPEPFMLLQYLSELKCPIISCRIEQIFSVQICPCKSGMRRIFHELIPLKKQPERFPINVRVMAPNLWVKSPYRESKEFAYSPLYRFFQIPVGENRNFLPVIENNSFHFPSGVFHLWKNMEMALNERKFLWTYRPPIMLGIGAINFFPKSPSDLMRAGKHFIYTETWAQI